MKWPRASGILAHITSLPGPYGVGDLGSATTRMLDFLSGCRQRLWQVLPLGPTGYGNSPYATVSAFAGNPLLISPERLLADELLTPADLDKQPPFVPNRVDYGAVVPWKIALLRVAHRRFCSYASPALRDEYQAFRAAQAVWLEDYALYAALKAADGDAPWQDWDEALAVRNPAAIKAARAQLVEEISFQSFAQFLFFRQWAAVRELARERSISIIGDLAIFVAHDSADVWAHPDLFQLDEHGHPLVVAGVPPDYFSASGQRWGNPLYRWEALEKRGFDWWIDRVRHARALVDYIRLDHFRGFHAYWEVPAESDTAIDGRWQPGPADRVFKAIRADLGDVPFIAEDLGLITPGVHALRRRLRFPGMKVLHFAFDGNPDNIHLPHNYERDAIVYTGTHDNDTTRGWFESRSQEERVQVLQYLGCPPDYVIWEMIRAAMASVATLAVVPLQDVLMLGSEARMNLPSRIEGNWEWRCAPDQLTPQAWQLLDCFTSLYGR
jgi:4-alpha-glucanotransferase